MNLTATIIQKIMPHCPAPTAARAATTINGLAAKYKMDSADAMHEFIATLAEESGDLTRFCENMNYSAERMVAVWPARFNTRVEAAQYAYNPQALAIKVYGGRMGNAAAPSTDGWVFRGGGAIQMTGKDIYIQYGKWIGVADPAQVADLVRSDLHYAIDSAFWVFAVVKGLVDEAIDDKFIEITKRINGGTTNMEHRQVYYKLAQKYML